MSAQRYLPYGGTRADFEASAMPTDRQFTGQRHETSLGFYDYNARQYDPVLGRFLQADTMVPERGNSQALNRYAYVANNPLKYVDPSGHCWGFASGVRDLPGYATNCHNFDMALSIVQHPQASTGEKALAAGYLTFQTGAHVALVVGSGVLVWQGGVAVASSVAGTKAAATAGTVATAACADGDCTNELHVAQQSVTGACGGDCSDEIQTVTNTAWNGVSAVGRALQKHSARSGSWLEGLASGGNAQQNTETGQAILERIVQDGTRSYATHPTFGEVIKIRLPDGAGAWWRSTGEFIGFLERYIPKK